HFCPLDAHFGLQSPKDLDPSGPPLLEIVPIRGHHLLHRDGDHDLRAVTQVHSIESGLGDADNRHGIAVEANCLADNFVIPAESALPVVIAQYGDRIGARETRVFWRYQSSGDGADAEHIVVVTRDEFAQNSLGLACVTHAQGGTEAAQYAAKYLVL